MSRDYYTDAERIAKMFELEDLRAVAQEMRNVVAGGSIATEILMGLRHTCQSMLEAGQGSAITRAQVREFVLALDDVLA